jgi:opacity protein-like surface antigen
MKSRIVLGTSVLALMLGGGAQATASVPAGLDQTTTVEVAGGAQAKAQLGDIQAKTNLNVNLNVDHRTDRAPSVGGGQSGPVAASGELPRIGNHAATAGGVDVRSHFQEKGTRTRVSASTEARSRLSTEHAHASSRAHAKAKGATRLNRPHRSARKLRDHAVSGVEDRSQGGAGFLPLDGIGREVGYPVQLQLAWLIVLTGAGLGLARLVRRGRLD